MRAVYAQAQVNAGRHQHVRMSVWQFVRCRGESGREFNAHALQLSPDDAQIIPHNALREGERLRLVMEDDDLGFDVETDAVVGMVETDMRGNSVATVEFDGD